MLCTVSLVEMMRLSLVADTLDEKLTFLVAIVNLNLSETTPLDCFGLERHVPLAFAQALTEGMFLYCLV